MDAQYTITAIMSDPQALEALRGSLERLCAPVGVRVATFPAAAAVKPLEAELAVILSDSRDTIEVATRDAGLARARRVLLGTASAAAHATLPAPWAEADLYAVVRQEFSTYIAQRNPEALAQHGPMIDLAAVGRVVAESQRLSQAAETQLKTLRRSFLASTDLSDEQAERAMITGLDQALAHPPRQSLPAGTLFLKEGEAVEGIWIVLEGQVQLTRELEGEEVILQSHTAGPIIGLLAAAQRQRAFFNCRAMTPVVAMFVTWKQLDDAMQTEPSLSMYFVTVLIRSLTTRFRRIVDLQMEVELLNRILGEERDQLTDALHKLEQAQTRLIESEKMATLGQLSAGVAHELNNPVTAIRRAADYVGEDVSALVESMREGEMLVGVMRAAQTASPLSTSELRERRDALAAAIGDGALARRLLSTGITTAQEYATALGAAPPDQREQRLAMMERAHQLGTSLRNIRTAGERITSIVRSLKSYARADERPLADVDLHEGLEDTLLLFGPALMGVELVRRYGQIPHIECRAGEINQVWTNLISNALDAMGGKGSLAIETAAPDDRHVSVSIVDDGPGIPPEHLQRVFDLNFTTKHGRTRYGLGMGLTICRQIVGRHGGTIVIDSRPGHTRVTVTLPVEYPSAE